MKRFSPVLALMLILILTAWDDASSNRYPEIRIDEVDYDHPWGGEENNPDTPINYSTTTFVKNDLTIIGIIKSWNFRFFFYGSTFLNAGSKGTTIITTTTTTTTTTVTEPGTSINSSTSQGGLGQ